MGKQSYHRLYQPHTTHRRRHHRVHAISIDRFSQNRNRECKFQLSRLLIILTNLFAALTLDDAADAFVVCSMRPRPILYGVLCIAGWMR